MNHHSLQHYDARRRRPVRSGRLCVRVPSKRGTEIGQRLCRFRPEAWGLRAPHVRNRWDPCLAPRRHRGLQGLTSPGALHLLDLHLCSDSHLNLQLLEAQGAEHHRRRWEGDLLLTPVGLLPLSLQRLI